MKRAEICAAKIDGRVKIMRVGVFADCHDHLDNVRHAVAAFNRAECRLVIFAGDLVSPMVVPVLRKLRCPLIGCFGDNDGNKTGILGGMKIVGALGEPPFAVLLDDGTRVLLTHVPQSVRGLTDGFQVVISGHTHRPRIHRDEDGVLYLNPGETSGWTFRKPSIALLETEPLDAEIILLPEMPPLETE
ncbi:MAG: YfcE family phosphodiesterase [Planctomycetes bacterium]|nr:YfcE family phosphodiesterase [Planctomycetota bacterium]